jgi:rare lipoprotein A
MIRTNSEWPLPLRGTSLMKLTVLLTLGTIPSACTPRLPEPVAPQSRPATAERPGIEIDARPGETRVERPDLPRTETSRAKPLETRTGTASYYSDKLHNRLTASGVPYDRNALVAAHRSYPFGTVLRVTNLANDRVVTVRVVDRGPFIRGRILDLSRRAAEELNFIRAGLTEVRIEVLEYGSGA